MQSVQDQATALVARMTLDEKAGLCSGASFWRLKGIERLGLRSILVTDGPHGLRKQVRGADHGGLNASVPATCFPTASALASTWNRGLLHEVGVALGKECKAEDVAVLLGPGMNIKRHPLCGRNFEYFSEDPLLTGELAAAMTLGIQSQGVGACPKHFAVNNQEQGRMVVDAIVDERSLREIYLRGFEIAVKQARPWTLMCAYNKVNGVYCSEHERLLNRILRDEWGFAGLVMTDWGAANDRVRGLAAGLDLEMPGSGGVNDRRIAAAVATGELSEAVVDQAAVRIASLILTHSQNAAQPLSAAALEEHHALARRATTEGTVLLKNEDDLLPLPPPSAEFSIAAVGAFAKHPRYQGTGSSRINPTRLDCAFDAVQRIAATHSIAYAPGYDPVSSTPDLDLLKEAAAAAQDADAVLLFAGLPETFESEGFDRQHLGLPEQQNRLIEAVCAANPNTAVVLANGAPVEMPWVDKPKAILEGYLGGQAGGAALADLLFGRANPSGKLAETFPLRQADVPSDPWFPGAPRQVQHREGVYVGYRYYDSAAAPVLFPFGHGLSYTQFQYDDLAVRRSAQQKDGVFDISLTLANAGDRAGAEVVQLYVHPRQSVARHAEGASHHPKLAGHLETARPSTPSSHAEFRHRPEQELRAFAKVFLNPGERRRVEFRLDRQAFACYCTESKDWVAEAGAYELRIGASSRDIRLTAGIELPDLDRDAQKAAQARPRRTIDCEVKEGLDEDSPDNTQARLLAAQQIAAYPGGQASATDAEQAKPPPSRSGASASSPAAFADDKRFAKLLGRPIPPAEPSRPFHLNSTLGEISTTWLGRRVRARMAKAVLRRMGQAQKPQQDTAAAARSGDATAPAAMGANAAREKMLQNMLDNLPLRGLVLLSGGTFSFAQAEALVALLNGRLLATLRTLLGKKRGS